MPPPLTVRIFISSTFKDMHSERDYLVKYVFPELKERCIKKGLALVDVDLRWGVTEEEAEQGKAIEICLDEIENCPNSKPSYPAAYTPPPAEDPYTYSCSSCISILLSDPLILFNLA
ncbi:MAG: DUF4062 domain-containing protein [Saprospiraceae bacterium]|nr:DUF4062 domain-containing protein [Saprospiraceae bacterium]